MHLAGHYYHVYNRGCNREPVFATGANYVYLLRRAKALLDECPVAVVAYCLMPNHYHFLLRPHRDGADSVFLQRLFASYTQAFNRQQGRSGTLFEGRPKSILVDSDEYVLRLCCYIHLNPVKAGLAEKPGDWAYSNYLEWVGRRHGMLVDREFVRQYFADGAEYEAFVRQEARRRREAEIARYLGE